MKHFTCEICGRDAGPSGVVCPSCHKARCQSLLRSRAWVAVAKTRSGDLSGESLYDTIKREARVT